MRQAAWQKVLVVVVQASLTMAIGWYLTLKIDLDQVAAQFLALSTQDVALLTIIMTVQFVIVAARLQLSIKLVGLSCSFGLAMRAFLIGAFFSQTPLTSLGGDMMRVWSLVRGGLPLRSAASAVTIDRIFGIVALLLIILLMIVPLWLLIRDPALRTGIALAVGAGVASLILFLLLRLMPSGLRRFRLLNWIADVAAHMMVALRSLGGAASMLGLGLAAHVLSIVMFYVLARSIRANVSFVQCLILVPFPLLLSLIPISLGGWGVREGAMIVAFGWIGVPSEQSLAVSVIYGASSLLASLPGGLVWLFGQRLPPANDTARTVL